VTDDESPGAPFRWGLRPAQQPSDAAPSDESATGSDEPAEPAGTQAIDQGEFLALPLHREGETADATPGSNWDDDDGEPTAAFDFRAPPPAVNTLPTAVYHEGPALPWEAAQKAPAPPPAVDAALQGSTELVRVGVDAPVDESAPTNPLDRLFGEENFQEYEDAPAQDLVKSLVPVAAPKAKAPAAVSRRALAPAPAAAPRKAPRAPAAPHGPLPKSQRIGLWVAGGLVAATVLTGLFFVGTRLPDAPPAAPTAAPAPVAPPVEEPAIGPVSAGEHEWDELLGTECVEPYTSAWEQEFTVVDCAEPHGAQLVYRGRLDDSALDAYPGVEALQARMSLLCAGPENIDYAAAGQVSDVQLSASFPGTEEAWAAGDRDYFCFVTRSSGEPLTMNLATPPRAPVVVPVAPAPEP